jgi:chitodextrinase
VPGGLAVTASTATSLNVGWTASTDNVGVVGYGVYRDGTSISTSSTTSAALVGLSCGKTYHVEVDAVDAAGNRSARAAVDASTAPCADTTPPSSPGAIQTVAHGATTLAIGWAAATDNVGVASYGVYLNGVSIGSTGQQSWNFAGLNCATSYTVSVDAVDAAGNRSPKSTTLLTTDSCPDSTPPSTPSGLAASNVGQTSATLSWNASSDNVGVADYRLYANSGQVGTTASLNYGFRGLACGTSYALGVAAYDAAGNASPVRSLTITTQACPTAPAPSAGFDWFGNSYSGANFDHVPHGAQDMAVAPDGMVATVANWIESGHEVKLYDENGAYGPRSGIHDGTARSVALTNSWLYVGHGNEIIRWSRATFKAGDQARSGVINTGGTVWGLAVCGGEVYASDLSQIRVFRDDLTGQVRSFSAPNARYLTCDRQGNVWAIRDSLVARYSPTGTLLASFTPSGMTLDIAADPSSDTILVTDNGPDQRIEKYSYTGAPAGTLGVQGGYLAGPTPGLLGPGRFVGPRGVGIDAVGNVYVASTGEPGLSLALSWGEIGRLLIIDSYDRAGTRRWKQEGLSFSDSGQQSPDGSRFYTREVAYERGGDGRYRARAFTVDPFSNPNDRRIPTCNCNYTESVLVRDFGGHRYLAMWGSSGGLMIYRMNGEIAVPASFLSDEASNDYIQVEGLPRENRPGSWPGNLNGGDMFIDADGDVYRAAADTRFVRYRLQGLTAAGNPIYRYADADLWSTPPGIAETRRVEVYDGIVYVSGYGPGEQPGNEFDGWRWVGKRLVKFPSLPVNGVWPAASWTSLIHYEPGVKTSAPADRPASWAADPSSGLIAVGYQYDPGSNSSYLRFYSTATGAATRVVHSSDFPPEYGERGWLDMPRAVSFVDGWVWMEENHLSKQVGMHG